MTVAALVVTAFFASSAAATNPVYVPNKGCAGHTVRPQRILIACVTGQFFAGHLRYTAYGGSVTNATGVLRLDDCVPNCTHGTFRSYPGQIRLSQIVRCQGRRYYARIWWTFIGQSPVPRSSGREKILPAGC